MFEFTRRDTGSPDCLFLERLDAFMDKCLADIRAFSEREYRPYEETRQYVAEWHSRFLFQPSSSSDMPSSAFKVRSILCDASRILESLYEASGVQSFILAVDPSNPSDEGFLGGSAVGREFWRGLRGGGEAGAKSFKTYCLREINLIQEEKSSSHSGLTPLKQTQAKSVKNELYENVRKALRSTSGIRNAEMKWTNPERLNVYGVRLIGWPPTIPAQNPSTLKLGQNKLLLECLGNGTMRFERIIVVPNLAEPPNNLDDDNGEIFEEEDTEDFSWAYDAEGGGPSSSQDKHGTDLVSTSSPTQDSPMRSLEVDSSNNRLNLPTSSIATSSSRKRPRDEHWENDSI